MRRHSTGDFVAWLDLNLLQKVTRHPPFGVLSPLWYWSLICSKQTVSKHGWTTSELRFCRNSHGLVVRGCDWTKSVRSNEISKYIDHSPFFWVLTSVLTSHDSSLALWMVCLLNQIQTSQQLLDGLLFSSDVAWFFRFLIRFFFFFFKGKTGSNTTTDS